MNLFSEEPETPMSADLLQRCKDEDAIDPREIADLLNVAGSTAYDYFGRTELRFGQFRTIFRHAQDDRVRDTFLSNLLHGTRYIVQRVDTPRDVNGDGRCDTKDALASGIGQMARSAEMVRRLHDSCADGKLEADECDDLILELDRIVAEAVATRNVVSFLKDQSAKRRKAFQRPLGLERM